MAGAREHIDKAHALHPVACRLQRHQIPLQAARLAGDIHDPIWLHGNDRVDRSRGHALSRRIDDDCVFYTRLDKQKAVQGIYAVAHHGDVISITGKVASNPAKKEVAIRNMTEFLQKIIGQAAE